jgi:hypothetical protein
MLGDERPDGFGVAALDGVDEFGPGESG